MGARSPLTASALRVVDDVPALLRELIGELRGLRADLRRRDRLPDTAALRGAIGSFFGDGRFSARGVILAADESPALADALFELGVLDAKSPSIALGRLLAADDAHFERVGEREGAAIYRLIDPGS